jgi:FMN phosphatase YigB (HAD superfamily)
MDRRKAWIFDVDGTLANVDSILHHVVNKDRTSEKFKKNFNKFHAESVNVPPHFDVVEMLTHAWHDQQDIIVVTARKEMWRPQTAYWLSKWKIPHHVLFMRENDDNRPDYEVKKDILDQINKIWDVTHAVDDNPKIIRLWQENGISTTKIGTWDGEYK